MSIYYKIFFLSICILFSACDDKDECANPNFCNSSSLGGNGGNGGNGETNNDSQDEIAEIPGSERRPREFPAVLQLSIAWEEGTNGVLIYINSSDHVIIKRNDAHRGSTEFSHLYSQTASVVRDGDSRILSISGTFPAYTYSGYQIEGETYDVLIDKASGVKTIRGESFDQDMSESKLKHFTKFWHVYSSADALEYILSSDGRHLTISKGDDTETPWLINSPSDLYIQEELFPVDNCIVITEAFISGESSGYSYYVTDIGFRSPETSSDCEGLSQVGELKMEILPIYGSREFSFFPFYYELEAEGQAHETFLPYIVMSEDLSFVSYSSGVLDFTFTADEFYDTVF